ncbi:Piso0_002810 [Millerozyma farinosa CBS 7064]|uniref:Piso0_002810 protein n=1 Tax=Pichia sorbitophila (strain ATCC MYA-4447 / BCRC 22081 / CBS 7064 / NBRC 10061 / NRRL Y-12695) TaxID=559304 RepID=G8YG14_PICSO|nr:Piso0_002810 [Millerozyma farinosa CBS 7064]
MQDSHSNSSQKEGSKSSYAEAPNSEGLKAYPEEKEDDISRRIKNDPFYGLSFRVGVAENKNIVYRDKMEDVHTYIANFAERLDWGYFAIFDGHAGKQTARWCGNNLHSLLEQEILASEHTDDKADEASKANGGSDMRENLNNVFVRADELIEKQNSGSSGCTAVVAVLGWELTNGSAPEAPQGQEKSHPKYEYVPSPKHKRMLYTSNVGDSRIVLYRNGKSYRLTYDHKASDVNEMNRIRDTGGLIMKNRVNGVLAVTRSLGDSYMKDLVIGNPFTTSTEITPDDEFLVLACDGLWDVISDDKACQFIADYFKSNSDPHDAAQKLCQLAMDNSTTDNVTVMIVKFDKDIFNVQKGATQS